MITYNDIYEAARKERYSKQLQSLPKKFVYDIAIYLKEKQGVVFKGEDILSDTSIKTKKQLENVAADVILKDLTNTESIINDILK